MSDERIRRPSVTQSAPVRYVGMVSPGGVQDRPLGLTAEPRVTRIVDVPRVLEESDPLEGRPPALGT